MRKSIRKFFYYNNARVYWATERPLSSNIADHLCTYIVGYLCYSSCRKDIMRRGVNSSFNDTDTDSWKNSLSRWLGFLNLRKRVCECAVYVCKTEKKL